jgi:hypothetical protein
MSATITIINRVTEKEWGCRNGEWGDHVTLQAAADYYGVKISLITSFKDTCFIEIVPTEQKSKREMYLSFWAEVHYNSIYPIGDLPRSLDGDHTLLGYSHSSS